VGSKAERQEFGPTTDVAFNPAGVVKSVECTIGENLVVLIIV
jgi:hypothetical protein